MRPTANLLCALGALLTLAPGDAAKKKDKFKVETTHMPKECERKSATSDMLSMHYTGFLAKGGKKFDSSRDKKEPLTFQLGVGQVIKGWDLGLRDMCVGEQRKLIVPPDYGYGDKGAGEKIPGKATLIFETELISIEDGHRPETIFNQIDKDGDGRLSKEEVQQYLVRMGGVMDEVGMQMEKKDEANSLLDKLFLLHDANEDGVIEFDEFKRPDRSRYRGKEEGERRRKARAQMEAAKGSEEDEGAPQEQEGEGEEDREAEEGHLEDTHTEL